MRIQTTESCCSLFELTGSSHPVKGIGKRIVEELKVAFQRHGVKYGLIYMYGIDRNAELSADKLEGLKEMAELGFQGIEFSGRADFHGGRKGILRLLYLDLAKFVDDPNFMKNLPKPEEHDEFDF